MKSCIIFGRLPPPIGGVTKSVSNLCEMFSLSAVTFKIFDYSILELRHVLKRYDLAHVNSSSPIKRLVSLFIGFVIAKKAVFVVHGNRFDPRTLVNRLCLSLASGVIVLNENVKNSILSSGYSKDKILLQSPVFRSLDNKLVVEDVNFLGRKFAGSKIVTLYSNHGGHLDGKEVYGFTFFFSDLIDCFNPSDFVFVVVDLDGSYKNTVSSLREKYEIIYFDKPVDFSSLLKCTDLYIRPTNFDGSSIAVLEALQCNVKVIASNVVDRPKGVITYDVNDKKSFSKALELSTSIGNIEINPLSDISELFEFYRNI